MLEAKIRLPNFATEFDRNVVKEIKAHIFKRMPSISVGIKKRLQITLADLIRRSDEYSSLTGGELRGQIGLEDPSSIEAIIDRWAEGIEVRFLKNKRFGSIKIGMIQSDYSDVLTMPEASYTYVARKGSKVIDWLRWLLLEGSQSIVQDYNFAASKQGRTGLGIMVSKEGGSWKVPAAYAGTAEDNFVTRSLRDIEKEIDIVVKQEVSKGL